MSFQPLCLRKAALLVNGVSLLISNLRAKIDFRMNFLAPKSKNANWEQV